MTWIRDRKRPRYIISIAAELAAVHPRTLRIYDEEGLVCPHRRNNLRLYSEADIERVRIIRFLTRRQGVNLAGVKVILQLASTGKIRVYDVGTGKLVNTKHTSFPSLHRLACRASISMVARFARGLMTRLLSL